MLGKHKESQPRIFEGNYMNEHRILTQLFKLFPLHSSLSSREFFCECGCNFLHTQPNSKRAKFCSMAMVMFPKASIKENLSNGNCFGINWLIQSVSFVLVVRYRVISAYPPQHEAELELRVGDVVYVTKKRQDGWYKGTMERNGKTGLFPGSFVDNF